MRRLMMNLSWFAMFLYLGVLSAHEAAAANHPDISALIAAPLAPALISNPQGTQFLALERSSTVPLSLLANETIGLAGVEIDVRLHALKRTAQLRSPALIDVATGAKMPIALPGDRPVSGHRFSPNGRFLALAVDGALGVELWIVETANGQARQARGLLLTDLFVPGPVWSRDSKTLYVSARPSLSPLVYKATDAPTIEEATGVKVTARTYAYLLKSKTDEALFESYALTQILRVDAQSLKTEKIGKPGLYTDFRSSPDDEHLLVQRMSPPYSYAVPADFFARHIEVWSTRRKGEIEKQVLFMPLADNVPPEGERTGPRDIRWQPDHPARLLWVEALDGGDPRAKAEFRDRLLRWDFPFKGQGGEELARFTERFAGLSFFEAPDRVLIRDNNPDTDMTRIQRYNLKTAPAHGSTLLEYSVKDAYRFPGRIITDEDRQGITRIVQDGDTIFLAGNGRNPKGEKPFLRSLNVETLETKTLFEADEAKPYLDDFVFFEGRDTRHLILSRESKASPPNLWALDLKNGAHRDITHIIDNVPLMTQAEKKPLVYKRKDGLSLSGTLFVPKDRVAGEKLPAVVWAYPEEYRSSDLAGQVRVSDKRYSRPGALGIAWLVTQGYVVLDNASMPVVGGKETANNTFIEQIVANAEAAVNALDELGFVDKKRIAIGGHSYGAFMTANVLAHTNIFCAGIARSGAYNRSLTPFGFQAERRMFWEAKEFYMNVSPFYYAENLKTPILFIHGKKDTNPGTVTIQTERMFNAVRGVGGRARMVLLPYESHAYKSRENITLMHEETLYWLGRFCG
ncbi:MAG: S9 family peptidase [Chitinophagaceae bacterium]|nr:S9 family peptidase [Oligoflexus sp.]